MSKILRCECGKLFVQHKEDEQYCSICIAKQKENDDPFIVTPINIGKLLVSYKQVCATEKKRLISNTLLELDFVLNNAYMRGYISEEFYTETCSTLGITPDYDNVKSLIQDDYYDYSPKARIGFYQDLLDDIAE